MTTYNWQPSFRMGFIVPPPSHPNTCWTCYRSTG